MAEAVKYQLLAIPGGIPGIRATLKLMSNLVKEYKKAPEIRELALEISQKNQQKDFVGEARAIHNWVRDKIRYVKDIRGVETIQTPLQTLRLRAGDCDDKSLLSAALLESIGHPTRFMAVGFEKGALSHVITQTKVGPKWLALDTTEPVSLGWMPKGIRSAMVQHNRL